MAEPENDTEALLRFFNDAIQTYAEIIGISTKKLQADMRSLTVEKMRSESKSITVQVDSTARRAAQITFDLFINLGGLGAEIVGSAVWPPAALCFNGLKFLIQSGGHYKKHFTVNGINETLHSVAPVLDDIRRYVDGFKDGVRMENSHREVVERRLKLFLEVCAIATKVHRDNGKIIGKIKNYAKSAAGDDGGVGLKLKEMEEAQKREQHILLGDVWKTNQMIGNYIDFKGVANTRALRKIRQMLPLSENSPCWNSWAKTHTALQESMMEDTGAWVLESDYFKSWADGRNDAEHPVLIFESEPGSGKSHLCCAIINELYQQSDNRSNPALVAYFYFERPKQQSSKDIREKTDVSFRDALAALIWQISERDSAFRTFLSLQSGSPRGYASTAMLWDVLMKFPRSQSSGSKKVFFLVIDGVNLAASHGSESLEKTLGHIIECVGGLRAQNFQVRVLVSGTPECLKGLAEHTTENLKRITVTDHNQEDIKRFVQTKIRELSAEWGNKELGTLVEELREKTCRNAGGSYYKAIYAMDEIQQTDGNQDQLESIRRRGPENDRELIAWHVNRLNNSLEREEINQLNKILVCVHFMEQKPRVEHLKAFLRLDSKSDLPKKFGDRIQSRYGQLLAILPDETVTTRSEDPKPPYMDLGRVEQQKAQSSPASQQWDPSMTLPERSEIVVAQTLIQSHFPAEVVDRLGFNAFFHQLHQDREGPPPTIGINRVDGHLQLIASLLKAVRTNGIWLNLELYLLNGRHPSLGES
ncbi:hypothetical protein DBV05_g12509 [Lasiodiplodia theobromae]|uniref:Uncharacterized protein n=1 Tax=Lasiodiplodia theobromae TaxID=45133 RepID=A0A5N5CU22_9PEZI|nr:hypothetical protein DBV05_g12509 [Lasiodiplodia theobromae]